MSDLLIRGEKNVYIEMRHMNAKSTWVSLVSDGGINTKS